MLASPRFSHGITISKPFDFEPIENLIANITHKLCCKLAAGLHFLCIHTNYTTNVAMGATCIYKIFFDAEYHSQISKYISENDIINENHLGGIYNE